MFKARKKKSDWTFNTSSGASAGVSVYKFVSVGGSKGTLVFNSPDGAVVEFQYASLGVGVGKGWPVNLSGSTRDFKSAGEIICRAHFPDLI